MKNLATRTEDETELEKLDQTCSDELIAAGIELFEGFKREGEVPTKVRGSLHGWLFTRAWRYWIAEGPGIPPYPYANSLHKAHGNEVRVDGNCTCPSPLEWSHGLAIGHYHVDSAEGLKALADTLGRIVQEAS